MPKFSYTLKNREGKTIADVAEYPSQNALVEDFQSKGFFIVSVEELGVASDKPSAPVKSKRKKKQFTHKSVKLQDISVFARQLSTMLQSGVTLLRAVTIILSQVESSKFFEILSVVRDDVEQGNTLSSSLAKHPKVFSQFWVSLVEVGEASGTMPMVLEKLTAHMEEKERFRSAITSALVYPMVLAFICTLAIGFFAIFIGPRFEKIFKSMDAQLPLITEVLLASFTFIREKFVILIAGIIGLVYLTKQYLKTEMGARQFESIMFRMPVFGDIYRLIIVERFASQLAILVDSGVPILYALEITERLVENYTAGDVVKEIHESVKEGNLLAHPMEESGFFPNMAVQMIKVGEETGELGKMLGHVSQYYQRNVSEFMARLGTLIEPIMLIVMGLSIGSIVIAMFLPLFNLSTMGR